MAGYISPALRGFIGAPKQSGAARAEPSAIERLSFELFGDLDGEGGTGAPGHRHPATGSPAGPAPENPRPQAPLSLPVFNSFAAVAAYDASLRRPERVMSAPGAPEDLGEVTRGHAVYSRQTGQADTEESAGLVLDQRS